MKKEGLDVVLEKYEDGTMALVFSKEFVNRFDKVFGDKPVIDIFVAVGEKDKKMVIEIEIPKEYIM